MDWIRSLIEIPGIPPFPLVHFDSVESPIVPGTVLENPPKSLEKATDLLGSVLWQDAVSLFVPYLVHQLTGKSGVSTILLGEGTGACGCGLARTGIFKRILVTDLPDLLPLLQLNASLNQPVSARAIDWTDPRHYHDLENHDVVIGCEVLYGNRFVWEGLLSTITNTVHPVHGVVYICVTLRNKRRDVEDFSLLLGEKFKSIEEFVLNDNVSVIKATNLK
jgi:hypothetical protein